MLSRVLDCEKEIDWDTLQRRFPAIAFELCYGSYEKISCFQDDIEKEMREWKDPVFLEGIDILYVYGAGLGHLYKELKDWLHSGKERRIVFFEENIAVLDALFKQDIGSLMLSDLQVHFYYVAEESVWDSLLEECLRTWMSDRIEWIALRSYTVGKEKWLQQIKLKLLRKSSYIHAKTSESMQYHRLIENIAANLLYIPHSFYANQLKGKFKNVPAVICGAGYSLGQEVDLLKQLETKALLIAGGSAITALGHYGIKPHIAMAVDPNEEEYNRLKTISCFETPFVFSSRLYREILPSTHMQMGYLCSNTGGEFEAWVHDKLGIHFESFALKLGAEALSITTLAVAFAVELGCNPIVFCGVDLAYSNSQRYCPGVMPVSSVALKDLEKIKISRDRVVRRKNIEGQFVHTLIKWVMEASCLGSYAKAHPTITFFNLSSKGLPILKAETVARETLMKEFLLHEYDLRGRLHSEAELASFPEEAKFVLEESFKDLRCSFEACLVLFEQMQQEIEKEKMKVQDVSLPMPSGKMSVLEMDLEEQPAYIACLHPIFFVFERMLEWWSPINASLDHPEGRLLFLEKKAQLWKNGKKITQECLCFLRSC